MKTKSNSNGYDIRIDEVKVIAEVKCNIPLNDGEFFGREQRAQIEKDLYYLLNGKNKVKDLKNNDYFKFFALSGNDNTKVAFSNLFKIAKFNEKYGDMVELYSSKSNINKEKVFVIFV
ncbi:hypothetical protein D3C81_1468450 [compost metagenome]